MSTGVSSTLQLAAVAVLIALIALNELIAFIPAFRLVTFALCALLLADLASLARARVRDLLVAAASFAFGLCLIETAAIGIDRQPLHFVTEGLYEPRPVIGHGPAHPGVFHDEKIDPKTGSPIYKAAYAIDSNLLRRTRSGEADPAIVFFGDSMTFGVGVDDHETLPQQFADSLNPKQRVLNLALGGHGPPQFLRELETGIYDQLIGANARAFIFLTAAFHTERSACKPFWCAGAPRYALENGQVRFKGLCHEAEPIPVARWLANMAAYRVFVEPFRLRPRHDDVELYIEILSAAVRLAKVKYGVETLIPYIRWATYLDGAGFTDDEVMTRLKHAGAIVIDASLLKEQAEGAKISIEGDGHPTPLAHRMRALLLKTYIEANLSGVLLSSLN